MKRPPSLRWPSISKPVVGLIVIAYNQPDGLRRTIESAFETTELCDLRLYVFLHSRYPEVIEAVEYARDIFSARAFLHGKNRGVARSWNDGLVASVRDGCDIHIVSNDDVVFSQWDLDGIAAVALNPPDPNTWLIKTEGWHERHGHFTGDHGMAVFGIRDITLERVGAFDENYFPAYNEDTDYALRADRAGLVQTVAVGTEVWHLGSAAIYSNPELRDQNHLTHSRNDRFWDYKWGCRKDPDDWARANKHPFGDESIHPYFISFESRSAPYPGYNRVDHHIVKF